MSSKKNKQKSKITHKSDFTADNNSKSETISNPATNLSNPLVFLYNGIFPYLLILITSVTIYSNTFSHQFALDDDIVICKNEYVLKGISGMNDIFTKDLFDSFYKQMNTKDQLSGGRFRPLSVASFAIEQEFIGTRDNPYYEQDCWDINKNGKEDISEDINKDGLYNDKDCRSKGFGFRHINNVLIYGIACMLIFLFLSKVVFKEHSIVALLVTLLFAAHPIHTEVVANVKSRDEIFSILFMMLTLFLSHRFVQTKSKIFLILTAISFLCALLSKEYGATLLLLIPLSVYLFEQKEKLFDKINIQLFIALAAAFLIYYMMRSGVVIGKSELQDRELLNNPYLLADDQEKLATKLFIFLKYLLLLIAPLDLSSDYGYNSIPYKNFSDPLVWLSILSLFLITFALYKGIRKKHWIAFAAAFYLLNILLVTNLIFNVGATMGERLAFHSSLGYCMALGFAIFWLANKIQKPQIALLLTLPIVIAFSLKTYARNKAWENDITLALTDVKIQPESTSLNGNAASRYLDLSELPANSNNAEELVRKSINYGKKALALHPGFVNGYLNLGLAYAKIQQYDSAKNVWDIAFRMYPSHPNKPIYFNMLAEAYWTNGYNLGGLQRWQEGKEWIQKAINLNPNNARYWYDLGGFAYNAGDFSTAKEAWQKAYQLNPSDTAIQKVQGLLR